MPRISSLTKNLSSIKPVFRALDGIPQAMAGTNPAFSLPTNYNLSDLAGYEGQKRTALGQLSREEILKLAGDYSTDAAKRRSSLSSSLLDYGQKTFDQQNPKILEDLNSRGLATSASAVGGAQTDALKQIALANGQQLNDFDNQTFNELNSLKGSGLSAELQGNQDALDSELDLRRTELERQFQGTQAAQEQALAEKLAKEQGRNQLYSSLIGAGGNLLGAGIIAKGGGLLGTGTAAGTAGTAGYAGMGGTAAGTPLIGPATAPAGFTPGLGTIGAAGIGSMLLSRAAEKKAAQNFGTTAGNIASVIANPIGAQLNQAKKLISNPVKTVSNAVKSVTSVFCFDAATPIDMEDGTQRPINQLYIGAETKGGVVKSIRTSETENGTRYSYRGIKVTGNHAVKEHDQWVRVKDAHNSIPISGGGIVWSIVTDKHRVFSNGVEMADEHESDNYENLTMDQSLAELNQKELAYGV